MVVDQAREDLVLDDVVDLAVQLIAPFPVADLVVDQARGPSAAPIGAP